MSDMREAFERDYSEDGKWPRVLDLTADGSYRYPGAQAAWFTWQKAWQAARAQSPAMTRIAQKKIKQLDGKAVGLLVKAEHGDHVAVDVHGRVQRLDWGETSRAQGADICKCVGAGNGCGCDRCEDDGDHGAEPGVPERCPCLLARSRRALGLGHRHEHRPPSAGVPEGWRLVPIEPTEEMVIASEGWREYDVPEKYEHVRGIYGRYRSMISAAPQPPSRKESVDQSAGLTEPDMFWDANDTEHFGGGSPQELASDIGCDMEVGDTLTVRVQCAVRIPDRWIKITAPDEFKTQREWVQPPEGLELSND